MICARCQRDADDHALEELGPSHSRARPFSKNEKHHETYPSPAMIQGNIVESGDELRHRRKMELETFILNRLKEVLNPIGGVIGYKLNLNADETERLIRAIEAL